MPTYTLRILGPTACGSRISGPLLRDLLDLVAEGSRRALRLRVEGRSVAKGTPPAWLSSAMAFDFTGLSGGSCMIHLDAPALAEAAPEQFEQGSLFLDHQKSALALWLESLEDALEGKADSDRFDASLLDETEDNLKRVFSYALDGVEITNGTADVKSIVLKPESVDRVRSLRLQTPSPHRARVAGRLDTLRHSDRRFTLILADGSSVTGIAEGVEDRHLADLWGQPAVVSGLAVFRPSGALLRIEADHVTPASSSDMEVWSEVPRPLEEALDVRALHKPQGPRSGVNAIFGKWPGDETDEEIDALLEENVVINPDELILLDTGVLLHLLRGKALGRKLEKDYNLSKRSERPLISIITVGEILAIARRQNYSQEKLDTLDQLLKDAVVVNVRRPIAEQFAETLTTQQAMGLPIGENDTWIAATAKVTGSTLMTTDRDDFGKLKQGLIKLEIIDQPSKP